MNQNKCQVCKQELHSITTKSFGSGFICRDCSALLMPLLDSIADGILSRAKDSDLDVREFVISEIEMNFAPVISEPFTVLQMLK